MGIDIEIYPWYPITDFEGSEREFMEALWREALAPSKDRRGRADHEDAFLEKHGISYKDVYDLRGVEILGVPHFHLALWQQHLSPPLPRLSSGDPPSYLNEERFSPVWHVIFDLEKDDMFPLIDEWDAEYLVEKAAVSRNRQPYTCLTPLSVARERYDRWSRAFNRLLIGDPPGENRPFPKRSLEWKRLREVFRLFQAEVDDRLREFLAEIVPEHTFLQLDYCEVVSSEDEAEFLVKANQAMKEVAVTLSRGGYVKVLPLLREYGRWGGRGLVQDEDVLNWVNLERFDALDSEPADWWGYWLEYRD